MDKNIKENYTPTLDLESDSIVKNIKIFSIIWFLLIPLFIVFILGIILTIKAATNSKSKNFAYYLTIGIVSIITSGMLWIPLILILAMKKEGK